MAPTRDTHRPEPCPAWCSIGHRAVREAEVHLGGALLVRRTVLRLCTTIDTAAGTEDGPFVLLGSSEFTLHEAEALIAALSQLVDQGRQSLPAQQA
ncbi:hypothetical protein GCM10009844_15610 [Nocardioides koreensis]|uniref:DUF1876 domain-containing protein n=1 Tax=Nocardioides koreensis TaxID=433651 RepID=A0ABN2ZK10_9ACTN